MRLLRKARSRRPRAPWPACPAARPSDLSGALHAGGGGGLHYMSVSSACRSLMSCNSPRLVTVRSRFEVVWCPKCRPPRRKTLKIGCCGRGGLRFGRSGVCRGVSFVREPLNMRVNPLIRTQTPRCACGQRCPRASHRVNVRVGETRCEMAGPDMASGPADTAAWPCRPGGPVV